MKCWVRRKCSKYEGCEAITLETWSSLLFWRNASINRIWVCNQRKGRLISFDWLKMRNRSMKWLDNLGALWDHVRYSVEYGRWIESKEKILANLFCIIIRFIVNYANRLEWGIHFRRILKRFVKIFFFPPCIFIPMQKYFLYAYTLLSTWCNTGSVASIVLHISFLDIGKFLFMIKHCCG